MGSTISESVKEKSRLSKEEWKEYTKTVWHIANVTHDVHPAVFPDEIPRRLIKLFSFYGETVLDPFGGTGTTARVAHELGRKSIAIDQKAQYLNILRGSLNGAKEDGSVQVIQGDARKMDGISDETVDLIVTSPPYWNKADYGQKKENIGKIESYDSFLKEMEKVLQECYRVLKPGRKVCIVTANVNQHTDHGLLTFPLAADLTVMGRKNGLVLINEIIWSKDKTGGKWGSANGQRPIFGSYPYPPNFLFKNVHEFIVILAKPNGKKTKGPKVKSYSDIMGSLLD